jgi:hypothetical protein
MDMLIDSDIIAEYRHFQNFSLVKRFIKAQPLENQRDLWDTTIDLLNASKAFNNEKKEEIREELLVDCFKELENLNNTILCSYILKKPQLLKVTQKKQINQIQLLKVTQKNLRNRKKKEREKKEREKKEREKSSRSTGKAHRLNWFI